VDKGVVKLISPTDRNSKLLAQAKAGAAEDRRDIAKQDKEVQNRKNGDADVKLGLAYLSLGDADKAVEALQRGLSPERLKDVKRVDDAYMTLGISYLKLGKKEEAAKAFTSAQAMGPMAKAASLWLLQTN
jgi:tetratricopeptide (TPR) repeat protein